MPDPYFGGEGPERAGCIECGGCMVGCRHNSKNTLDKNYLYLAEKLGVQIIPETEVLDIRERPGGGYEVDTRKITDWVFKRRRTLRARGVVLAGGVLGTVPLLLKCKHAARSRVCPMRWAPTCAPIARPWSAAPAGGDVDYSRGIAIASGFWPTDDTHIEMVRYGRGQDFMSLLCTVLVGGGPPWPRPLRFLGEVLRHPLRFLRCAIHSAGPGARASCW